MAAVVSEILNGADKTYLAARAIGNGVPIVTDLLYTDTNTYPVGSEYFDLTGFVTYRRVAVTLALTDWVASAASVAV